MNKKESISDIVLYLLKKAKERNCSESDIERILSYVGLHSDHLILGRVFGYSVSDYAIATLRWINTDYSLEKYDEIMAKLNDKRKNEINELINTHCYRQL